MGVELQHCAVYGYRLDGEVPWDDFSWDEFDRLHDEYCSHDAGKGDFVLYQDGRGGRYTIAGIVHFLTDSARWSGPQTIEPTVMEKPDSVLIEAMEKTIDEEFGEYVERKTSNPEHIVFTHNW